MLILENAGSQIIVQNDDTYTPKSSDNKYTYEKEYFFGDEKYVSSSKHSVTVKASGSVIHTCILLATGGASGVHDHSAILHKDFCMVAVGPYLVALRLPVLDLEWYCEVDMATCFGVYQSSKYNCFISHGETDITQVFHNGKIGWQRSGKDIFTNEIELFEDHIIATDFNDEQYRIEIATGEIRLLK